MSDSLGISTGPQGTSALGLEPKRHAACDECRKRKLKCSGDINGCSRCLKQSIPCNYSMQKPMGRPPKKRARENNEGPDVPTQPWPTPEATPPNILSTAPDSTAAEDHHYLCPQLFWQTHGRAPTQPDLLTGDQDHNHSWRPDRLENPNLPVFQSSSSWPDFSTVSESSAMPVATPAVFPDMLSLPLTPPSLCSDSAAPQCTCLSYLYLCLSHISSIAAFPVNNHTLCSLYIAARTAKDIIRCENCPKNFASGVQNVMFTGTLLTVVADAWLRVYKSDPVELGMQSAQPEYISQVLQSEDPARQWSIWLRQVVRRAVIGGPLDPGAMTPCSNQPSVLALIDEVENRQRRWHAPGNHPFPHNPFGSPGVGQMVDEQPTEEKELLCMRVVGSARAVVSKFNFEPHEFPTADPNGVKKEAL